MLRKMTGLLTRFACSLVAVSLPFVAASQTLSDLQSAYEACGDARKNEHFCKTLERQIRRLQTEPRPTREVRSQEDRDLARAKQMAREVEKKEQDEKYKERVLARPSRERPGAPVLIPKMDNGTSK